LDEAQKKQNWDTLLKACPVLIYLHDDSLRVAKENKQLLTSWLDPSIQEQHHMKAQSSLVGKVFVVMASMHVCRSTYR